MTTKNDPRTSIAPDGVKYLIPVDDERQVEFDALIQKIERHRSLGRQIVAVQGLGFVGAAVAAVVADASDNAGEPLYFVIGVDLPSPDGYWKVASLNEGRFAIASPDASLPAMIDHAVNSTQNLCATVTDQVYSFVDVIIVDIPLDVTDRFVHTPDEVGINLAGFEKGIRTVGRFMRPEALVLIETTVPIGATQQVALPALQDERKQRGIISPVNLAHAYERVMPGPRYVDSIRKFWRSYAGINQTATDKARDFLSSFIDTDEYPLWELGDTNSSELAKLLENSYRAVNIAMIYEWTLLAEQIGVDLFDVINSIRVRRGTHDNMRTPGFGVGGYCLTKDSLLAQWSSNHLFGGSVSLELTLQGLQINNQMPLHTFDLLMELAGGSIEGKTVVVCGVSYLPGVGDTRNSPTEILVDALLESGVELIVHDSYVMHWPERPEIPVYQDLAACLGQADGIVFAVAHQDYVQLTGEKLLTLTHSPSPLIVDAQNVLSDETAGILHQSDFRLMGVGKGHWRKWRYHA